MKKPTIPPILTLLFGLAAGTALLARPANAQTDPAQEARLLWSAGNQVGATHWAAFENDRDGTLKGLRNIVTLYKATACLDAAPWQRLLDQLEAGASPRALFSEIVAQEDREMKTSGISGYACTCRPGPRHSSLAGHWSYFRPESPQETFPARISEDGSGLLVETAETRSPAFVEGGDRLVLRDGGGGRIVDGGNRINWANGYVWLRARHGLDLIGDWSGSQPGKFQGLPQKIWTGGPKLLVETHERHQASAHLTDGGDTIWSPEWNLRGAISADGRRIDWANGTVWVQTDRKR